MGTVGDMSIDYIVPKSSNLLPPALQMYRHRADQNDADTDEYYHCEMGFVLLTSVHPQTTCGPSFTTQRPLIPYPPSALLRQCNPFGIG